MSIDAEDLAPLLEEVDRFARERVATLAGRPEIPIPNTALVSLSEEARELGLLGGEAGLWQSADGAEATSFSLGALRRIARADAGVAFAWHRAALAAEVAARLGAAPAAYPLAATLVVAGRHGIGRTALARWLTERPLDADERAHLAAPHDRSAGRTVVIAPADWETLVWPVATDDGPIFECVARGDLEVEIHANQHGFDGLVGFRVWRPTRLAAPRRSGDGAEARRLMARVLKLDLLGLAAIGAGALDHGLGLARDYAAIRRQGGRTIAGHPAVKLLLGEIETALRTTDRMLAAANRAVDDLDLADVVHGRLATQERLAEGASQVVQVFGGIGYMRDTGAEKILRDVNMLRFQAGGLLDTRLFAAALTGGDE